MKYKATVTIESEDDNKTASIGVSFDPPMIKPNEPQPLAYDLALRIAQAMNPSNIDVEGEI